MKRPRYVAVIHPPVPAEELAWVERQMDVALTHARRVDALFREAGLDFWTFAIEQARPSTRGRKHRVSR